jgi:hypothetical protein
MDTAYEGAVARQISADISDLRWIIFSDLHRARRGPDDRFLHAERAYNAALGYYVEAGYTLLLLGDVEELWAHRPGGVIRSYPYSLELESEFHVQGRYVRFYGNHDAAWAVPTQVREHLWPIFPGLEVIGSLRIRLMDGTESVGTLFLAHGHQGSTFSDRHKQIARFAVRTFWRPAQRILRSPWSTPAVDFELRERHDRALYRWAARRDHVVLIAGHTHRPVFMSESRTRRVTRELADARTLLEGANGREYPIGGPDPRILRDRVAGLRAELEWIRTSSNGSQGIRTRPAGFEPCYFNTGCCSFPDGDITGLEISDGQIRLVRWPDRQRRPRPQTLAVADLRQDVFRPSSRPAEATLDTARGFDRLSSTPAAESCRG